MEIGFIGLGNMGRGMAANLLKAGHHVSVYNRCAAKAEALLQQGATTARTIAEACGGAVVFTMLADHQAVENVTFGDGGIVASLKRGATHVSSSTISVAMSQRLAAAHAEAGQQYAAAPVFGRPEAASAAKLFVIVDRLQYVDILTSTLFAAPAYQTYGGLIARREFEPAGFAATLGLKDIRLVLAATEQLHVPLPVAGLLRDRLLTLLATGGWQLDWSAVATHADREAGNASTSASDHSA